MYLGADATLCADEQAPRADKNKADATVGEDDEVLGSATPILAAADVDELSEVHTRKAPTDTSRRPVRGTRQQARGARAEPYTLLLRQ